MITLDQIKRLRLDHCYEEAARLQKEYLKGSLRYNRYLKRGKSNTKQKYKE